MTPTYVEFICSKCKIREYIPFDIVDMMDKCDEGNPACPPRFRCEHCNGTMEPIYYRNYKGIVYTYKEN